MKIGLEIGVGSKHTAKMTNCTHVGGLLLRNYCLKVASLEIDLEILFDDPRESQLLIHCRSRLKVCDMSLTRVLCSE